MPYATTEMMGIGNYVGEVRQGPDGQLYEWVEGVDGLGNPIGFWRGLRRLARGAINVASRAAGMALPLLARFIPSPLKWMARRVCNFIPRVAPVVAAVPEAAGPFRMANRFCGVLRRAGIAGVEDGIMEVPQLPQLPNLSQTVPAPVRTTAKAVCGIVNRLAPIVRFIPPLRPYASGATTICRILNRVGIAGADGLMESPGGQLYEVVEGIGEFGERRRYLRPVPVNIIIPALIKRRRHRGLRHGLPPTVLAQPGLRPAVPVAAPVPVRRFR